MFRRGPDRDVLAAGRVSRRIWLKVLATPTKKSGISRAERLVQRLQDILEGTDNNDEILRLAALLAPALGERGKAGTEAGQAHRRETRIFVHGATTEGQPERPGACGDPRVGAATVTITARSTSR